MPLFQMRVMVRRKQRDQDGVRAGFDLVIEGDHADEAAALEYIYDTAEVMARSLSEEASARVLNPRASRFDGYAGGTTPSVPLLLPADIPQECPNCCHFSDGLYPWWDGNGRCPKCSYPFHIPQSETSESETPK